MTKPITQIKIGDIINVNTGYRPLDDENCKVIDIIHTEGLFGDKQIEFLIDSRHGKHWYSNYIHMTYENNKVECQITIGTVEL